MAKYETATPLGHGAMGEVFKAFDPVLQRFVALKYLRFAGGAQAERLMREARLQARVDHDLVCKVYDVGVDEGRAFIAMQYIDGRPLEELAERLTLAQKLEIVRDVSRAVQAAHETGLIHRDLKPQNILLEPSAAGGYRPYVLDFGLAREHAAPGLTESGMIVGTPAYMAPEQARGETRALDARTDVYALGAVLYRLVTGRPPFEGGDLDVAMRVAYAEPLAPRRLVPGLPASLEAIILKCLEKEPERRYASARAVAEDLQRFLDGEAVVARAPGTVERLVRRVRRNPARAAAFIGAGTLVLTLGGVTLKGALDRGQRETAALRLGQQVASIEGTLRQAHLLPRHDTRAELALVERRVLTMQAELATMGRAAEGTGRYALGRAYLALHRYPQAQAELERAWEAGEQTPDVAQALGQALGARYQRAMEEAQRIRQKATREARMTQLDKAFREPAFAYLQKAGQAGALPPYVDALEAFYARRYDEAVDKARRAQALAPGLYEAGVLEADVARFQARARYDAGLYAEARVDYEAALQLYAHAAEIARSDALVYERQCECGRGLMDAHTRASLDAAAAFQAALSACDKALVVDRERVAAHVARADLLMRRGGDLALAAEERTQLLGQAQASAAEATRLDPRDPDAQKTRGVIAALRAEAELERGRDPRPLLTDAIAAFEASIGAGATSGDVYQNLGNAYLGLGTYERNVGRDPRDAYGRAIAMERRAMATASGGVTANAHTSLGIVYKEAALYEMDCGRDPSELLGQAVACYRQALEVNPRYYFALANLANAFVSQAEHALDSGRDPSTRLDEAREACRVAAQADPRQAFGPDLFLGHAEILAARWAWHERRSPQPPFEAAETALRRSAKANPDLAETRQWLAELYRRRAEWRRDAGAAVQEEVRRGVDEARRARSLDPSDARALALEGVLQALAAAQLPAAGREERRREATARVHQALQMNPLLRREFGPLLVELDAPAPRLASAGAH